MHTLGLDGFKPVPSVLVVHDELGESKIDSYMKICAPMRTCEYNPLNAGGRLTWSWSRA